MQDVRIRRWPCWQGVLARCAVFVDALSVDAVSVDAPSVDAPSVDAVSVNAVSIAAAQDAFAVRDDLHMTDVQAVVCPCCARCAVQDAVNIDTAQDALDMIAVYKMRYPGCTRDALAVVEMPYFVPVLSCLALLCPTPHAGVFFPRGLGERRAPTASS